MGASPKMRESAPLTAGGLAIFSALAVLTLLHNDQQFERDTVVEKHIQYHISEHNIEASKSSRGASFGGSAVTNMPYQLEDGEAASGQRGMADRLDAALLLTEGETMSEEQKEALEAFIENLLDASTRSSMQGDALVGGDGSGAGSGNTLARLQADLKAHTAESHAALSAWKGNVSDARSHAQNAADALSKLAPDWMSEGYLKALRADADTADSQSRKLVAGAEHEIGTVDQAVHQAQKAEEQIDRVVDSDADLGKQISGAATQATGAGSAAFQAQTFGESEFHTAVLVPSSTSLPSD